ncbi:MAG: DUF2029 domain-containing protein, partial [Oscillochloris sp.]|nr:DUF2029 domain-containing protein [Oscillochloris sp.]
MRHTRWRTPVLESIHGVAAIIVALVVIGVGYAQAWPLPITIGVNDTAFIENVGRPEYGDGRVFRWTSDSSQLSLPQPPLNTASVLTLRIQDSRKLRPEQPDLTIRADAVDLVRVPLPRNVPRLYSLLIPPVGQPGKALVVELQTTPMQEYENARWLGVALFTASLSPTSGSVWLPSLWVGLCAATLGLCTYLAARLAGVRRERGLLIVAGAAAIVAVGLAARPIEILPFIQRLAGMAAIAGLGIGLARLLAPVTQAQPARQELRSPPARLLVSGAHLPIYLALGAWMLLLFQQSMAWDGAKDIGGFTWDIWIGVALGVMCGLGLLSRWALRRRGAALVESYAKQAQVALVVLGVAAGIRIGFSFEYVFTHQAADFWVHFKAVREWVRGAPLYNLEDITTNHFGKVFKVPPFYAMLYLPFVRSIGGEVLLFWQRIVNAALLGCVALIWLRMWRLPLFSLAGAALLIVFSSRPIVDTLTYGQTDALLLCLLTLALWALREERDSLAGALVAL